MWKLITAFFILTLSISALACWRLTGSLAANSETFTFNQKIAHNRDYSFPLGVWILNLKVNRGRNREHEVLYDLHEKKGTSLGLMSKGKETIEEDKEKEIYAKGEPGQPFSIITIKIIKH